MVKILKISSIVVLGLIVCLILFVVGLRLYYSDDRLKSVLEDQLSDSVGGKASVDKLELTGWLNLGLTNLTIKDMGDDSIWLKLDDLELEIAPWDLLSKRLHIRKIALNGGFFDYSGLPVYDTTQAEPSEKPGYVLLPFTLAVDSCSADGIRISGPDADLILNLRLDDVTFVGPNDFTFSYDIKGESGTMHFKDDSLGLDADFVFSLTGTVSDSLSNRQRLSFKVGDLMLHIPDQYEIGNLDVYAEATPEISAGKIVIDTLGFSLNGNPLIDFTGNVVLQPELRLELDAGGTLWEVAGFADLAHRLKIPLRPRGTVAMREGRLVYTLSGVMYDFAIDISNLGFEFGNNLKVTGVNGRIYSDGDLEQIIFGSSISVDSLSAFTPEGSRVDLSGISSDIEAEITGSEYSVNITSKIVDILGGKLDFSAFSDNSKLSGELKISDMNLARISVEGSGNDTTAFGILDLTIDIGGVLDSITADLRADAQDLTILAGKDTLNLGRQNLEIKSITLVGKNKLRSTMDYSVGPLVKGTGEVWYPLGKLGSDSLTLIFDLDVDNSLIPDYFPGSLSASLGPVDLSGKSGLKGRLTSPTDSLVLQGRSELSISPTDLLLEDFQSLFSQLVSLSEVEISRDGVDVDFSGDIGELYAEEYSDLPFPDIKFDGKIVSISDTSWRLTGATARIPSINTIISATGDFGLTGSESYSNFDVTIGFASPEPVKLNSMISMQGELEAGVKISQNGDDLDFSGKLSLEGVSLTSEDGFICGPVNGNIPLRGRMNLRDSLFVNMGRAVPQEFSTYRRNRIADLPDLGYGNIVIDAVSYGDLYARNIQVDASFRDGLIEIPYLFGEILGGSFIGDFSFDLREINMMREYPNYENIRYSVSFETVNLDFNQLIYGFGPFEKKANFTSAAHFSGSGIPVLDEDSSIEGVYHISQMGPKVLDRVLDFIDPANQNPGVIQTRALLNKKFLGIISLSYKPREFIAEIKYGALYPALYMTQPFYADFIPLARIPMPIRYGRIPLNSLMTGMEEQ